MPPKNPAASQPQRTVKPTFATCPFTVAIDTKEQLPYPFSGIYTDSAKRTRPLTIPTQSIGLKSGDYSIIGLENRISVERKTLSDLYSTVGQGLDRFRAEHERLAEYDYAAVVVEADWETVLFHPPSRSRLNPKCIARIAIKWPQRYGVHWIFAGLPVNEYQLRCDIIARGLDQVAKELEIAFLPHDSYEQRIAKVIEAKRSQQSRWMGQQITFRTLEAFWNIQQEKQ